VHGSVPARRGSAVVASATLMLTGENEGGNAILE
jgi:hypothetical protein